jgi:hypothetical protein
LEAQQRAPSTVLIPDGIPANWNVHCVFTEPRTTAVAGPGVTQLQLRRGARERLPYAIAAADRPDHHDHLTRGERWKEVSRNGTVVHVTKPQQGPQAQAHVERDGTFVFLISDTPTGEQLVTLAASLKPAPSTSSI